MSAVDGSAEAVSGLGDGLSIHPGSATEHPQAAKTGESFLHTLVEAEMECDKVNIKL